MIYVTGDTHGDITRFKSSEMKKLSRGDTLIIAGDFGFIWDDSKQEKAALKKQDEKNVKSHAESVPETFRDFRTAERAFGRNDYRI